MLAVFIVALNVFVCLLVCLKPQLQTSVTNRFVVSLAVSDILTGAVLFPVYLVAPASLVTGYLVCIILLAGVANLCAVTYDRYVAVMKPLQYSYRIPQLFRRVLVACWTLPTVYSLLPLCWETDIHHPAHKVYIICLQLFGVVIPYVFISHMYYCIFRKIRGSSALKRRMSMTPGKRDNTRASSEARVALVFFIISTAFILSWLPVIYITTVGVLSTRTDLLPTALLDMSFFTVALSSIVNPLTYSFMKPDFILAIRTIGSRRRNSDARCSSFLSAGKGRNVPLDRLEPTAIEDAADSGRKTTHAVSVI